MTDTHTESPAWLDREAYPFTSRFIDVPGGRMHYVDEGQGEPIVFAHGVPTWSFNYRHLIRTLSQTHRCIAMDHIGFGLSSKPATADASTPQMLADNVARLITGLDLRGVTMVGHDWGGPIGLSYAVNNPGNVRRLVLFNTWMWPANVDRRSAIIAAILAGPAYRLLEDRINFTARFFIPQAMGDRKRLTREAHRHYIEPLRRREDRAVQWELIRGIRHASDWLDDLWSRRDRLQSIPSLIVWGMKDRAFTRHDLERWTSTLRPVTLHTLSGVGHFPQEEAPDQVSRLMESFMASAGSASKA